MGLRLNMVKSGQPSSTKCAVYKSFKYTPYICLNCKLYYPCVLKWDDSEICRWVVELLANCVDWLIDLGPRNCGFYTGLIGLPKIHRILEGMPGLWSSAETLHIQKSQRPPCLIEDPWGRRFWIFSSRIFCNDFITKFLNMKTFPRDHTGSNVSLA